MTLDTSNEVLRALYSLIASKDAAIVAKVDQVDCLNMWLPILEQGKLLVLATMREDCP